MSTLIRANKALTDAKKDFDFTLKFRAVDYQKGGVLVATDAALGNVTQDGVVEAPVQERVHSQSCYAVMSDEELMAGRKGYFNTVDFRSHRIPRVCRSSYAAETLGAEEGLDVGELVRGFLAECRGLRVDGKDARRTPTTGSPKILGLGPRNRWHSPLPHFANYFGDHRLHFGGRQRPTCLLTPVQS